MIRVLVVDDHPALRAGLATVLRAEPGLVFAGESSGDGALWELLPRTRPDVVLLDYHLPGEDGLQICRRVKALDAPPRVLVYSAYASPELAIGASAAGADGLVNKTVPARELFDAIRRVSRGERMLPSVSRTLLEQAMGRVEPEDAPLLGLLLDGTPPDEAGAVLGVAPGTVGTRVRRLLSDLSVDTPSAGV